MSVEGNCQRCRKGAPCDEHRERSDGLRRLYDPTPEQLAALVRAADPSVMEDRDPREEGKDG